jgi:hypothetical protein
LKTGGLSLDAPGVADASAHAEIWEKVIRKVRGGMMPPAGAPRPSTDARTALVSYLETSLDRRRPGVAQPGRPLAHRLNRAEYANAVRDLLDLRIDPSTMLPADDSSGGFDNNADVLGVSPVLLESYLTAAERVTALALGDPKLPPVGECSGCVRTRRRTSTSRGCRSGRSAARRSILTLPLDGDYQFEVRLFRTNLGTMRGLEYQQQLEIAVDGERVHLASFGGDKEIAASSENPTTTGNDVDWTLHRPRAAQGRAAPHHDRVPREDARAQHAPAAELRAQLVGHHRLLRLSAHRSDHLHGPFNPTGPGDTPSRRRIFSVRPKDAADEEPVRDTHPEHARPARLSRRLHTRRSEGAPRLLPPRPRRREELRVGDRSGAAAAAASPKFVFRVERDPASVAAGAVYALDDAELASRLSFFLWSTIPDDELLTLAARRRLHEPQTLSARCGACSPTRRRSRWWTTSWGSGCSCATSATSSRTRTSSRISTTTSAARSTPSSSCSFASILREDRNVLDLMTADYTFLNERLAKHYGIPNVYGSHFRRVTLTDDARKGLLGKGAILMVTSHAHRTSPVLRGKWVLENVLGTPPPPPPDVVPPFDEEAGAAKPKSVRERMENHRRNPACASCHRMIDPAGLALENFDATGAWRTRDGGTRGALVDASGQLVDGTKSTAWWSCGRRCCASRPPSCAP